MAGFLIDNLARGLIKQWHPGEAEALPRDGSVTLLDTRTAEEYQRGSIEGLVNIPVDELRERLHELEAGKPVFGICRGVQLLNVALGGTLHQHVEGHSKVDGVDGLHATRAEGFVEKIYGRRFMVNSAHHQALDRLGRGLRAVQWAEDGIVEAVEHRSLPIWGVQWHPERLEEGWRCRDTVDGLRILRFFVSQCG